MRIKDQYGNTIGEVEESSGGGRYLDTIVGVFALIEILALVLVPCGA